MLGARISLRQRSQRVIGYLTPKLLRRLSLNALVFWAPIFIFTILANEVAEREPLPFDVPILNFLHGIATPFLNTAALAVTNLGGLIFVAAATLLLAVAFYRKGDLRATYLVLLVAGGAALMNLLLKISFQRTRPDLWHSIATETTYSFPSGHAMASSALAFSLMAVFWNTPWRRLVLAAGTVYIISVGLTRVYLGVHFPSDVLAGWCISLAWALLVRKVLWRQHSKLTT